MFYPGTDSKCTYLIPRKDYRAPITGQFHKTQLQLQSSQCFQITLQSAFSRQCKCIPESSVLWQSLHHKMMCWWQRQQFSLRCAKVKMLYASRYYIRERQKRCSIWMQ